MKKWMLLAISIGLFSAMTASANAQITGGGNALRTGIFFPSEEVGEDTWFAAGWDHRLIGISLPAPGVGLEAYLSTSVDYYESDGNRNIPVLLNYNIKAGPIFYSAGVGPSFHRLAAEGDEDIGVDFQASIGYELSGSVLPLFIQGKYYQASEDELRGFSVFLGVRF